MFKMMAFNSSDSCRIHDTHLCDEAFINDDNCIKSTAVDRRPRTVAVVVVDT